jgi:LacI family transcriptional regulator
MISDSTRKRIEEALEQLDYQPNLGARGLRASKTWTIGFILPSLSNPMYEPIARGAMLAADNRGYGIVLGSHTVGASAKTFAALLLEGRVDGLLVASGTLHDAFIREIVERGRGPVIPVNRRVEGVLSSVIVDDEGASRRAVNYLHGLGHQTIGGIFGPPEIDTAVRRKKGFVGAARRLGLKSCTINRPGWSAEDGFGAARQMLRKHPSVTAIYASTLLMGQGVLRAASEEARPVPSSLSVVCLHESTFAEYLVPPLSTVKLPLEALGMAAVDLLIERTQGGPERAVLIEGDGEIVERASTGPPTGA